MNGVLRHFAVRLWGTVFFGTAACILVLPFWQSILKLQWVTVPVVLVMLIIFFLLGFLMNQWGLAKIQRLIYEAGIWERGGVSDSARDVYERAVIIFDSFWLSPSARRKGELVIINRLARFYLSQPATMESAADLVKRHLLHHPEDPALARTWLEQIQTISRPTANDDLLAAQIGAVLSDDEQVQILLMQYYLSHQRHDFDALQTYRRVWEQASELPDAIWHALARMLLENRLLNDWTLQVYLKAHLSGEPYSLEGIVAAYKYLQPHPGNQALLSQAESIRSGVDTDFLEKAALRFREAAPVAAAAGISSKQVAGKPATVAMAEQALLGGQTLKRLVSAGILVVLRWISLAGRLVAKCRQLSVRPPGRRAYRLGIAAVAVIFTGVMIWVFSHQYYQGGAPDEQSSIQPPQTVKDTALKPFTIQVAAYLNPEDAKRYVSQLKKLGLDAFSTQAVSAQRKWYQVKVSSFETKLSAQEYGQKLKSQGVIDDFYVANFQKEIKSAPKSP